MKINSSYQNFKGYDALPLKALHLEESTSDPIRTEMENIAQQEGYQICYGLDYYKWAQDFKTIIEEYSKPTLIVNDRVDENFLDEMKYKYRIYGRYRDRIVTGGNSFIGKLPNGEKWMMLGEDELNTKTFEYISREYGIKKENIYPIPQQNYHIDMFLRPIGYPYVLVDNPELTREKFAKMNWLEAPYEYLTLKQKFEKFEQERSEHYYSAQDVSRALKKAGFIPIEIAGVFGSGINFMNAIINKHPDNKISYITNSSRCESDFISAFEKEFEKDLRQKIPNLDKVYFVQGEGECDPRTSNYLMDNLAYRGGGIHCMSLEEPDFKAWA